MGKLDENDYWVPEHVRDYLRGLGFHLPLEAMEDHIRGWHSWMQAKGRFYDYRDQDGFGRVYEVHRRSIHPAMRVCREWGSLLLNDKTAVVCEDQACTEWLGSYFKRTGFFPAAQATVVRAFGMGTGAWALWIDPDKRDVRIRRYDARMVVPLSWDEDQVVECAFVTRAFYRGKAVDQLQLHLREEHEGSGAGVGACAGLDAISHSLSQTLLSPASSSPVQALLSKGVGPLAALSPASSSSASSPSQALLSHGVGTVASLSSSSAFSSASLSKSSKAGRARAEAREKLAELLKELESMEIPAQGSAEEDAALRAWLLKGLTGPWFDAELLPSSALNDGAGSGSSPSSSKSSAKLKARNGADAASSSSSSSSSASSARSFAKSRAKAKWVDGSFASNSSNGSNSGVSYKIITVCFDEDGGIVEPEGVCAEYDTGCPYPTFALVKPAIENTRVDMSPYGQSVFADAVDAVQAVDLAFDAMINEIDVSKMRVFLSDVMFDREKDGKKRVAIPFGRQDCTVFRKVMSTEDTIQEFAPSLRTSSQVEALRISLQTLGDLCGFGITYFDFDSVGYVKTATEVASDNSALMRNIARHEHMLEQSIVSISRALLWFARKFGVALPEEGDMRVIFDDSIISDTAAEKKQDMAEVGVTLLPYEYRQKWYGESEEQARARIEELEGNSLGD